MDWILRYIKKTYFVVVVEQQRGKEAALWKANLLSAPFAAVPTMSTTSLHDGMFWLFKGALYRIQIICRRYTFWSYPTGLTIADPPG